MTTYTDEEIERINAEHKARKAFLKAKENAKKDPEGYRKAKEEFHEQRVQSRLAREAGAEDAAEGSTTAAPKSIKATAKATR